MSNNSNFQNLLIAQLKKLIQITEQSSSLVISELQAINSNTDNVESLLLTVNTSITDQTTTLDSALQDIEDAINNNSGDIITELQNIKTEVQGIRVDLSDIEADIEAGNITLTNILLKLDILQLSLEGRLDTINTSINTVNTNLGNKLDILDVSVQGVITAVNDLQSEVSKLTDGNTPFHEVLDGVSKTYSSFQSLTYEVFDGTASVTIGTGTPVTLPLVGSVQDITGATWTAEQLSNQNITINATSGKVYVLTLSI